MEGSSAHLEDEAEEPHPDRDGEAEESDHGGHGPPKVDPHVGSDLAEVRGDLGPKLGSPLVHLIEAPVHVAPQLAEALVHLIEAPVDVAPEVIEALVQVVDPFGEFLGHDSRVGEVRRGVKEGPSGRPTSRG